MNEFRKLRMLIAFVLGLQGIILVGVHVVSALDTWLTEPWDLKISALMAFSLWSGSAFYAAIQVGRGRSAVPAALATLVPLAGILLVLSLYVIFGKQVLRPPGPWMVVDLALLVTHCVAGALSCYLIIGEYHKRIGYRTRPNSR